MNNLIVKRFGEEIGTAIYFMNQFKQRGSDQDAEYFKGKRDALQETAVFFGLDMDEIQAIAARTEAEQLKEAGEIK